MEEMLKLYKALIRAQLEISAQLYSQHNGKV